MYGQYFFPTDKFDATEKYGPLMQKLTGRGPIPDNDARAVVNKLAEMTKVGVVEETAGSARIACL